MPIETLIDTGAMLALLDHRDPWHPVCLGELSRQRLPLLTSEAVLTELFHLAGGKRNEMEAAWRLVNSGAVILGEIGHPELRQVHSLMSKCRDRPMDFADATLVHLAGRESISTVFTIDRADFETYRIDGRRRFRIVPENRPPV